MAKMVVLALLRLYQLVVSPALVAWLGPGSGCRHTITCSQYAMDRVKDRGAFFGGIEAIKRLMTCHPFSS